MHVIVRLKHRSARRGYDGLEERVGRDRRWLEVDVVYKSAEEAEMPYERQVLEICEREQDGCHAPEPSRRIVSCQSC
jgi:hypothetical protein